MRFSGLCRWCTAGPSVSVKKSLIVIVFFAKRKRLGTPRKRHSVHGSVSASFATLLYSLFSIFFSLSVINAFAPQTEHRYARIHWHMYMRICVRIASIRLALLFHLSPGLFILICLPFGYTLCLCEQRKLKRGRPERAREGRQLQWLRRVMQTVFNYRSHKADCHQLCLPFFDLIFNSAATSVAVHSTETWIDRARPRRTVANQSGRIR